MELTQQQIEGVKHSLEKMLSISYQMKMDSRDLFQFGYNAGRLAELTGWRNSVWDDLKNDFEEGHLYNIQWTVNKLCNKAYKDFGIEPYN
jgi:hypothetical protein